MLLCPNLPEALVFTQVGVRPTSSMLDGARRASASDRTTSRCISTVCASLTLLLNDLITFTETNRLHTFQLFLNFLVFSIDGYVYPYATTAPP